MLAAVDYDQEPRGSDPDSDQVPGTGSAVVPGTISPWLSNLITQLNSSPELAQRTAEVSAIKSLVRTELENYLALSDTDKLLYAQSLGINTELISLSTSEAQSILTWLDGRSLHFGQSAYLALEALLEDAGLQKAAEQSSQTVADTEVPVSATFSRLQLATRLILTDILTGTLTPLEEGELVLSMYALRRVGNKYLEAAGVSIDDSLKNFKMDYDALKAMYSEAVSEGGGDAACSSASSPNAPVGDPCPFRFIAHINGNHFVIVTKVTDTEVQYIDPGKGPENQLESFTLTKEQFIEAWLDQTTHDPRRASHDLNSGFGYVLTSRGPPASVDSTKYQVLSTHDEQLIRGAFFFFLIFAFIAIVTAIAQAVAAVVTAIIGLIGSIISGIGSILSGIGNLFSGLFTGNFFAGIQAGFGSILHGLGVIFNGFGTFFSSLHGALLGGIQGIFGSIPYIGPALSSLAGTSAFQNALALSMTGFGLQGTGVLLEKMGVSPKITQTVIAGGKIAIGVGLLATGNPLGLAASLGFVSSGVGEILSLHTSLSPTLTNLISIGATALGAFAVGGVSGGISGALASLKTAAPYLAQEFASAGVMAIGNRIGLDWRISQLISVPVRAAVGAGAGKLFGGGETVVGYRNDGTKIIVSSPKDFGDFISGAIQTAPAQIGFKVEQGRGIFIPASQILNETVSDAGFLGRLFGSLKDAAVHSINFVSNTVKSIANGAISLSREIQDNGLLNTLTKYATQIFDRQTIETIFNSMGGIEGFLNKMPRQIALPSGQTANAYDFSNTTTILTDSSNNMIGQIRNGRYESGEFEIGNDGQFYLKDGAIVHDIGDGFTVEADVIEGRLHKIDISAPDSEDFIQIEGRDGVQIVIDPAGEIVDGIIDILHGAFRFVIENGQAIEIFSGTAYANVTIGGQPVQIDALDLNDLRNLVREGENTEEDERRTEWLIRFMSTARFQETCPLPNECVEFLPGDDGKVYTTNYFNPILDTPARLIDLLQLGFGSKYPAVPVGTIDPNNPINLDRAGHFVLIKSHDLIPNEVKDILREFDTIDGAKADGITKTGRKEYIFLGSVPIGERLIQASVNNFFNRLRAWVKLMALGLSN